MKYRVLTNYLLALCSSLLLLSTEVTEQKQKRKNEGDEAATKSARLLILQQELPRLTENLLSLKDPALKVDTLGLLGAEVWELDPVAARQIFQTCFELLRSIEPINDEAAKSSYDSSSRLPRSQLISLYVRFFSLVAKHDLAWKDQMFSESPKFVTSPQEARNLNLNAASMLLQEKDSRAYDFIEAGISSNVTNGLANTLQILELLLRLRLLDAKKADQLFLQVVRQFESADKTPVDDLFTLGNYLFTGPAGNSGPQDKVLISPVFVGTIAFHADISYDRPDRAPETVDGFLRACVAVITRPIDDPKSALENRAAAFLLLPKARRFAPDLVSILSNLSNGIDPRKTNSAEARSGESESLIPKTLESVVEALDKIQDPLKRDEYCLRMIWYFYSEKDFDSATSLTDRISSQEIRERLSHVILFGRAIKTLVSEDMDAASSLARRLPAGKDRSFLWFTIADRLISKAAHQNARLAIESGLSDARKIEGPTKASLLLLGSELSSAIDVNSGSRVLLEATAALNSLADLDQPLRFDRFVRLRIGTQTATFSTDITGFKPGTLRGALKAPTKKDPRGTVSLVLQLKNERVRSSALLALVAELGS